MLHPYRDRAHRAPDKDRCELIGPSDRTVKYVRMSMLLIVDMPLAAIQALAPPRVSAVVTAKTARVYMPNRAVPSPLSPEAGVVGMWTWDVRSDRLKADERVCRHFSVAPDMGQAGLSIASFLNGIHWDDRQIVLDRITYAVATGKPFLETYRVLNSERGVRWIQASGVCFRDRHGLPETYPGLVVDVTEQIDDSPLDRVAEKLVEAHEFAQEAGEAMLKRLIETVLLETGFCIARSIDGRTARLG